MMSRKYSFDPSFADRSVIISPQELIDSIQPLAASRVWTFLWRQSGDESLDTVVRCSSAQALVGVGCDAGDKEQ